MGARFDEQVEKWCSLSGLVSMMIAFGSQVALLPWGQQGWVYNQPSFDSSPEVIARFWADNHAAVMVGTTGFELAWLILIFWSVELALMTWRLDSGVGSRILTVAISCASMTIPFLMMVVTAFWTVAGYRARDVDPAITRAFADLGYIGSFIWFWTALTTMTGTGWLMLRFRGTPDRFPTWVGWISVIAGLTQLPALAVHFVYSGTFSLNGLLGWYVPLTGWIVWMIAISPVMYRMVKQRYASADTSPATIDFTFEG